MVDRVQPLKLESPDTGGTQTDAFTTSTNPQEDYLDARGVTHQNATSDDDDVRTERDASNNLVLVDPVTGTRTLAQLVAAAAGVQVKVSSNDTTAGFLEDKVVAGYGVALQTLNDGADEDLEVAVALSKVDVEVLASLNFSGGPVDGSGGGFTATAADAGDWLFMFEGYARGGVNQSTFQVSIQKGAITMHAGSTREYEPGSSEVAFVTSRFVTLADGDTVYGVAEDVASGTITLYERRLLAIKIT